MPRGRPFHPISIPTLTQEPTPPTLTSSYPLSPPTHTLREIHRVNERYIGLLAEAARRGCDNGLWLVTELHDVLGHMTPERCRRAGERPYLVADIRFTNPPWWEQVRIQPSFQEPPVRATAIARAAAVPLVRTMLTLAWHTARAHQPLASLVFGMTPSVSKIIAELSLSEIDQIASRQYRQLRPRWENHAGLWLQWLNASETEDIRAARDCDLR
jgi:hypothetical protein